ncbi:MAG: hypothetical protein E6K91_08925 [Thaumarchaeota archaeon]|nr:MAG: hypothetical protein E6K91_08925 [Nitrososphaerota archaeon]
MASKNKVEEITRNFLQQHGDVFNIKVYDFENGVWSAEAEVSSLAGDHVRKVRVDDKTCEIISVE